MLNTALFWHSKGIATIPLLYRSKKPIIRWKEYQRSLPTIKQLRAWFCGPQRNLALITTKNLVVLDFDSPVDYAYWFCMMIESNPAIVDTYMVTSARGLHLYYWIKNDFEPVKIKEPYEIKSHGQMINIPPSIHPSGIPYRAINSPDKIKKVDNIADVLTFSPVKFEKPKVSFDNDPWQIWQPSSGPVDLLVLFPDARQTDETHWLANCPFHGHKDNFMLDVETGVGYCFSGCGSFSSSELLSVCNNSI